MTAWRNVAALLGLFGALSCRAPAGSRDAAEPFKDPPPPQAPVLVTLTDFGPLEGDARAGLDSLPPGAVVGRSPVNHAGVAEPIFVEFSTPMSPTDAEVDFTFAPPLAGSVRWTSPTRLAFAPEQALDRAQRYTVEVRGHAMSVGGRRVAIDEQWTFETPRPIARLDADGRYARDDVEPAPVAWNSAFTLWLSDAVEETRLRDALTVEDEGHHSLPYRLVAQPDPSNDDTARSRGWRIEPRKHWPANATIRATLDASFSTRDGALPLGRSVFTTLRTRPGIRATIECQEQARDGCVIDGFNITFDEPLPPSALAKIRVVPTPENFSKYPHAGKKRPFSVVSLNGDFEPGTRYTVRFARDLRDVSGQSLVGPHTRTITLVAPPPTLDLVGTGTQLSTRGATLGLESRSVESAVLRISQLENDELADALALREHAPHGAVVRDVPLDLDPGGRWGWDARSIDLRAELGGKHGAALFEVAPNTYSRGQAERAKIEPQRSLVMLTNLGVMVADSPSGGFIRVLALDDASPVSGAVAHIHRGKEHTETSERFGPSDHEGLIRLPAGTQLRGPTTPVVIVETHDDRVAVALRGPEEGVWRSWEGSWKLPHYGAEFDVGVLMPDRELYQPGEQMRVMGWTARSTPKGIHGLAGSGRRPVVVTLRDPSDRVLASAEVRTKPYGKFWATLDIPKNAGLGTATIRAVVDGHDEWAFVRRVDLREFVAPAFDVNLALSSTELRHGQVVHGEARARYLHGMPTPIKSASVRSECEHTTYRPVNATGYDVATVSGSIGTATTSWSPLRHEPEHDNGRIGFDVPYPRLSAGTPYRCATSLLTMDAARQEISTTAAAWVHPSRYLLIRQPGPVALVGTAHVIEAKVVRPSGESTTAKPANVSIIREFYDERSNKTVERCVLRFGPEGTATCAWTPQEDGTYTIEVSGVVDGIPVSRRQTLTVRDATAATSPFRYATFTVPDRADVGATIDIDVSTPHARATGLAVEVHAGIREIHPFSVRGHRGQQRLPVTEAWVPAGYVDTFVVYPDRPDALPSVDEAFNRVELGYASRELEVSVTNPAFASVGDTLPIHLLVTDPAGTPVEGAHVSVWAADEGILMVRDWRFPNFRAELDVDRGREVRYHDGYGELAEAYLVRGDPYESGRIGGLGMGGAYGSGHGSGLGGLGLSARTYTRRNFDPAPIFVGDVVTGPEGVARVDGVLPDNLTTFRIAAVATAEVAGTGAFARAGRSESQVRVTQDLAVQPVLPRILRPGDTAQLGVLVDNLSGASGRLTIEARLRDGHGIARITSEAKIVRRLDGPQVRIPIDIDAAKPGEVRVWVRATLETRDGRTLTDASERPLEVRAERTLIRHAATYGSMVDADTGAVALDVPHDASRSSASVDMYTTLLGGFRGSARSLVEYPYGCVEQTASRLIPLIALHDLDGFDLGGTPVHAFVRAGVERLASMQTESGGFGYWPEDDRPHPYATAYATWVLSEVRKTGYPVDPAVLERAAAYLKAVLTPLRSRATPTAHEDIRAAMALLGQTGVGEADPVVLDALFERAEAQPAFALALLAMAVHANRPDDARLQTLIELLRSRIEVRGDVARTRAEPRRFSDFFDSPMRSDAMVLLALVRVAPDDPHIEPLARGLTEARDNARLRNTQEHAYALLAMAGYADLRESVEPSMDVRAWVGHDLVIDSAFRGRDVRVTKANAPVQVEDPIVTLQRLGQGRLYYRVGMQWSVSPDRVGTRARGIMIERTLYDARGVVRDRPLIAGAPGSLEISTTADARQRYVAIEVPLPAGLEAVDESLDRAGTSAFSGPRRGPPLFYDHHELRHDRVLVFVDDLPAGTRRVHIPVRATHEGTFSMPPATVHAMYSPEVVGNTAGRRVQVVSRAGH